MKTKAPPQAIGRGRGEAGGRVPERRSGASLSGDTPNKRPEEMCAHDKPFQATGEQDGAGSAASFSVVAIGTENAMAASEKSKRTDVEISV